jgi:hypothetical protein
LGLRVEMIHGLALHVMYVDQFIECFDSLLS